MQISIFNRRLSFLIFIGCILPQVELQAILIDWQSSTNLSSNGLEFSPVDQQALFLFETTAKSLISCAQTCHSTIQCRIFDYDGQFHRCCLFEGNIATMGSVIASSSVQSRVGSIKVWPEYFMNHGQPCSSCQGSRYLTCVNNTCQCPEHTFYDGSICQSQKLLGAGCNNDTECRLDRNYSCLSRQQCGLASMQTATSIGGYGNGTGGNTLNALRSPTAIAVAVDNSLYISDYSNNRVIRLQEGSSIGSIVAGTGVAGNSVNQLNGPTGLYVDASLNIYVADSNNYRIMLWRKNSSTGIKVAGSGSTGSTLTSFSVVAGLFVDSQENIYLADYSHHRVMKFAPNATNATLVAGTGVAGNGSYQLNVPYGVYVDEINSYLYVADYNNHRIQRYQLGVSTNGTTVSGGNGGGTANNQLKFPYSVCVSKIRNAIYIADSGNGRIQRWNSGATSGVTIAGNGASTSNYSTTLQGFMDIRLGINETYLFVSENNYNTVWRFDLV